MINNEVPSIKVPSTIQPSNINTFNALSRENKDTYEKALKHFIEETKKNKMFGQWNDYGRLLEK